MKRHLRGPEANLATRSTRPVGARRIRFLAVLLLLLFCAEAWVLGRTFALRAASAPARAQSSTLARLLGLTDLAVWTEARYTRNPALADFFSAFQDHPGAIEHFPAGSIMLPPPYLAQPSASPGAHR